MAKIKNIRKLEAVAIGIRELAIAKAPFATGNLRNKIRSANTPAKTKMIKQLSDSSIQLSLDYAPIGAEYGQWFNDPPKVSSKRRRKLKQTAQRKGNWNYAVNAINDKDLNKKFEEVIAEIGEYFIEQVQYELSRK